MHSKTEKKAVLGVASEEGGKEKAEQNLQKKELKKRRYETERNRKGKEGGCDWAEHRKLWCW